MQLHKPSIDRLNTSSIAFAVMPVLSKLEPLAKNGDGLATVIVKYLDNDDEIAEGDLTPVITISLMPAGQLRKAIDEQKTEGGKGED